MSTTPAETAPGWYGKLPSLGDFASRRLPQEFIEPWDLWLADRMAGLREIQGESWLEPYLDSPVWRFILMPGCASSSQKHPQVGVLMASVDRVGRYFPLTLTTSLTDTPDTPAEVETLLSWLHQLEDLALDALQDDWTIEQLEGALAQLPSPSQPRAAPSDPLQAVRHALKLALQADSGFVPIHEVRNRADLSLVMLEGLGPQPGSERPSVADGHGFWWVEPLDGAQLLVSRGMPGRTEFVRMFGAQPAAQNDDTLASPL